LNCSKFFPANDYDGVLQCCRQAIHEEDRSMESISESHIGDCPAVACGITEIEVEGSGGRWSDLKRRARSGSAIGARREGGVRGSRRKNDMR
jgi:hypothetical protein